ncbi:hypothetical protein GCM10027026_31710 [Myroides odoratimimus subsp. xuanwuensis]
MGFHITGEPESDAVLDDHPFAILAGMMLDQQYPMDKGSTFEVECGCQDRQQGCITMHGRLRQRFSIVGEGSWSPRFKRCSA